MKTSEQINDLAKALSAAQGDFEDAIKDGTNSHFRSSYATLAAVLDVVRQPLSKNGLAVIQGVSPSESGCELVTRLCHSSGQWIESRMTLMLNKPDMQGLGTAITYARRFSLAAIVGVTQKDDDGNSTIGHPGTPQATAPSQAPVRIEGTFKGPSEAQLKRLYAIANNNGWTPETAKQLIAMKYNVPSAKDLDRNQYQEVCEYMEKNTS